MYAVEVRDHIMIAHSFKGEFFGPAQRVHGATFVCDARIVLTEPDGTGPVADPLDSTAPLILKLNPTQLGQARTLDDFTQIFEAFAGLSVWDLSKSGEMIEEGQRVMREQTAPGLRAG